MMRIWIKTGVLAFSFLLGQNTVGQVLERYAISSTGASVSTGSIQLDYSVGEALAGSIGNDQIILNQGFIQGESQTTNIPRERITPYAIRVYPNPVDEALYVDFEQTAPDIQVQVMDVYGKTLMATRHTASESETGRLRLDFSGFAPGLYMLTISGDKGEWRKTQLILKQ